MNEYSLNYIVLKAKDIDIYKLAVPFLRMLLKKYYPEYIIEKKRTFKETYENIVNNDIIFVFRPEIIDNELIMDFVTGQHAIPDSFLKVCYNNIKNISSDSIIIREYGNSNSVESGLTVVDKNGLTIRKKNNNIMSCKSTTS